MQYEPWKGEWTPVTGVSTVPNMFGTTKAYWRMVLRGSLHDQECALELCGVETEDGRAEEGAERVPFRLGDIAEATKGPMARVVERWAARAVRPMRPSMNASMIGKILAEAAGRPAWVLTCLSDGRIDACGVTALPTETCVWDDEFYARTLETRTARPDGTWLRVGDVV